MLQPEEAAEALAQLERIEGARAGRLPPSLNAKPHLLIPWAWDLVHDTRILDAVEDLLGPDLLCWATSFIVKNVRAGEVIRLTGSQWGTKPSSKASSIKAHSFQIIHERKDVGGSATVAAKVSKIAQGSTKRPNLWERK